MRKDAPGHALGFSLVEAVAVVAVASILLALALPSFRGLLERQRTGAALHLLATDLALARNTAISRRTPVTVCPSRGDGLCRVDTDWSTGWLIYLDPKRSPQPRTSGDILQQSHQPVHPTIRVQSTVGRLRVRYQPAGFSGGTNLTLRICAGEHLYGEVVVNNAGRPRTHRRTDSAPCPFP